MNKTTEASSLSEQVVAAVAEGRDHHDPSDESHSAVCSNSHFTSNESTGSRTKSFSLAGAETQMIRYSKGILLFVIAAVAIATSSITYGVVKRQEHKEYERKFHDLSSEIAEFSQLKAVRVFNNLERFGTTLTSYALDRNLQWPFVVFPDFQVQGILSNQDTGAHTISVNPLVFDKDLDAWSAFTVDNQGWVEEAHAYDQSVHPGHYELEYHQTSYDHNESLRWNRTGITSHIWAHNEEDRYARKKVSQSRMYTPVWQRAPACDFAPQVNMDLRSNPTFTSVIDGMLAVDHPVITQVIDATYLETNYEYRFDPEEQSEPHSYVLQPVYDSLTQNRTIVAFLSAFQRWGAFFTDVLPDHEQGIFVVLESSCGQMFTYEVFGHKAKFLGEGDHHDKDLDGDKLEDKFEFSPESASSESDKEKFCHYYAHVYPSSEWRDQFYSSQPYTFALAVFCCFIATALGFVMYDFLVQKRQKKVMMSAARTNAIVTSLFPENVRDRLLEDQEQAMMKEEADKTGAFLNTGTKKPSEAFDDGNTSVAIFGTRPIADLFTDTTILFADLCGFTAWSSTRDPTAVFTLLETLYHSFDQIARRRRVFKVETIGDCYVAVSGLPVPRKDHAIVMGKFASDCLHKMKEMVRKLETSLGPDTSDLDMRVGLHSGPVTAGVLRGDKGRFQLFGDTMNTAARLESTGEPGKVHISRETAEILMHSGKGKWVTQRKDQVIAKGKGALTTFWLRIHSESNATGLSSTSNSSNVSGTLPPCRASVAMERALNPVAIKTVDSVGDVSPLSKLSSKEQRLVSWNVEQLLRVLRQIMVRRVSRCTSPKLSRQETNQIMSSAGTSLDEVKEVLALPQFDAKTMVQNGDQRRIEVSDEVVSQMMDMIARIASLYRDNSFHSFEHASHATMSVAKLLSRIVKPNDVSSKNSTDNNMAELLHDHTFGITSDPLTQFACLISALIHDADHLGVPNTVLVKQEHPLASKYKNKSVAEQNSVDLAWDIITSEKYKELLACIYTTKEEFLRFRSIIVNMVMATDIMDRDLGAQRKARWEKAFFSESESVELDQSTSVNRKATVVLEHLMQASDVAHTMQHWVVFKKWNERLFTETYKAYKEGHSDRDPSESWYQGELGFFDYYIIPLAKKLETCGVFGVSSHEYLSYAQANRREWEERGREMVKEYVRNYLSEHEDASGKSHQYVCRQQSGGEPSSAAV